MTNDIFADDEPAGADDGPAGSAVDAQIAARSKRAPPSAPPKPVKPPKPKRAKKIKSSSGSLMDKLGENKQPVFILSGILIAIVVVFGLSSLTIGDTESEHHAALTAIYEEHLELRKRKAKGDEWDPLIVRAEELKATMVPDLIRHKAGSEKRDLQELLWAVRDCLIPMLQNSHKRTEQAEREFVKHLNLAGKLINNPDYEKQAAATSNGGGEK